MKRSRMTGVVVAGSAVALAAGLIVPSAFAAGPKFTVKAGAAKHGSSVSFSGKTKGNKPQVALKDTTTGTTLTCSSAGAKGKITVGKVSGPKLGTVSGPSTTWKQCTGPGGLVLKPVGSGSWKLEGKSYKKGVTKGKIAGISAHLDSVPAGACSFDVTGSVPISYSNKKHTLALSKSKAHLKISNVTGCLSAVNSGDKSSFAAKYSVKVPKKDSPLTIKR